MGRPVVQWQILARNPDRVADFYCGLFDWTVDADNPLGYRVVRTGAGSGIDGGIWPSPPDGHNFVQFFVEVDDVAAYVERATHRGARVLIAPQVLPDGDEMAVMMDPEGMSFALYRSA